MKFKLSVTKYAEEAAARRFSVDPKRVREKGEKIKLSYSVCLRRTATGPGCLVEGG